MSNPSPKRDAVEDIRRLAKKAGVTSFKLTERRVHPGDPEDNEMFVEAIDPKTGLAVTHPTTGKPIRTTYRPLIGEVG